MNVSVEKDSAAIKVIVEGRIDTLTAPDLERQLVELVSPDFTTVILSENSENKIQLFDISGRLLRKFVVNENSFQLSKNNLKSGVYLLEIKNKKGVFRKKLVIQ